MTEGLNRGMHLFIYNLLVSSASTTQFSSMLTANNRAGENVDIIIYVLKEIYSLLAKIQIGLIASIQDNTITNIADEN